MEGQQLNLESLRSSVGHRLTLADASGADRSVEGLVQVMQDALANRRTRHSYSWVQRLTKWPLATLTEKRTTLLRNTGFINAKSWAAAWSARARAT
jgi:hypothetical protein